MLGVTGHRDLDVKSHSLRKAVRAALAKASEEYPASRIRILSSLAEGADRLVAKEAMRLLGARLVVPLPMPQANYERDFAASVGEFRSLLRKADDVFVVRLPKRDESWMSASPARSTQYARAGAYVAQHSQVLLALWDAQPARGVGGTAQVVKWFRAGVRNRSPAIVPARYATESRPGDTPVRALETLVIAP